jgi:hypothetical protein
MDRRVSTIGMASSNQATVARDEREAQRPLRARAITDAGRPKRAAPHRDDRPVSEAVVDPRSSAPSNEISSTVMRWLPLAVPLLAVLMCAMAALIWETSL